MDVWFISLIYIVSTSYAHLKWMHVITSVGSIIYGWSSERKSLRSDFELLWAWWRHQMETFSALLSLCVGNSPVPGDFPSQRPVTRSFDAFFDLRLNKRLSKQTWGWWFETPSRSLWRHRNGLHHSYLLLKPITFYSLFTYHQINDGVGFSVDWILSR